MIVPGPALGGSVAVVSQKPDPSETQTWFSGSTIAPDGSVSPVAVTVAVPAADAAAATMSSEASAIGRVASVRAMRRAARGWVVRLP